MDKKYPAALPSLTEALERVKHQGNTVLTGTAGSWQSAELPEDENVYLVPHLIRKGEDKSPK